MLWAEVMRYQLKVMEIVHIREQREVSEHQCFLVGLEQGLSRH